MKYTNNTGISLSLAMWLASDSYDYSDDPMQISTTTLLKPLKVIILSRQLAKQGITKEADLSTMVPSRMGTALHDSIENAWTPDKKEVFINRLVSLGIPEKVAHLVIVNPKPEDLTEDSIPVYMEQRAVKQVGKYRVSGKFDFVAEGRLEDFKSTSTFAYTKQRSADSYIKQGSIYRWLNHQIITQDNMRIQYIFTDWSALGAMRDKNYPPSRILSQKFKLMSLAETDAFVKERINLIDKLDNAEQAELPACTKEELWMDEPVWKYYKNPDKRDRSTKNFNTKHEADERYYADKCVGVIVKVEAEPKACKYCPVNQECNQAKQYVANGVLKI